MKHKVLEAQTAPAPEAAPETRNAAPEAEMKPAPEAADAIEAYRVEAEAHKAEAERLRAEAAAAAAELERVKAAKVYIPATEYLPQEAAMLASINSDLARDEGQEAFWRERAKAGDEIESGGKTYTAAEAVEFAIGYAVKKKELEARRAAIESGVARRFAAKRGAPAPRPAPEGSASTPPAPTPAPGGADASFRVPRTAAEAREWMDDEAW